MNQVLKSAVYCKGTEKQAKFIAYIGGMNEEETRAFMMLHDGRSDLYIQEELGMGKNGYAAVEQNIRTKFSIAMFECINYRMAHRE